MQSVSHRDAEDTELSDWVLEPSAKRERHGDHLHGGQQAGPWALAKVTV